MAIKSRDKVRVPIKVTVEIEVTAYVDKDGRFLHDGQVSTEQVTAALAKVKDRKLEVWESETAPRDGYLRLYHFFVGNLYHKVFYSRVVNATHKYLFTEGHKSGRWDLTQLKDSPFDTEDLARETSPEAQKKWRAINKAKKQEAPV